MKATKLLQKDHEAVKTLFAEFESAGSADEKADIFEDIREQLNAHTTIEEELFYPAVAKVSEEGTTEADDAREQHLTVKRLLEELDGMDADDDDFDDKMINLRRSVEEHIEMEEGDIFATAEELGNQRLSELGHQLQERKDKIVEEGDVTPDEDEESPSH